MIRHSLFWHPPAATAFFPRQRGIIIIGPFFPPLVNLKSSTPLYFLSQSKKLKIGASFCADYRSGIVAAISSSARNQQFLYLFDVSDLFIIFLRSRLLNLLRIPSNVLKSAKFTFSKGSKATLYNSCPFTCQENNTIF